MKPRISTTGITLPTLKVPTRNNKLGWADPATIATRWAVENEMRLPGRSLVVLLVGMAGAAPVAGTEEMMMYPSGDKTMEAVARRAGIRSKSKSRVTRRRWETGRTGRWLMEEEEEEVVVVVVVGMDMEMSMGMGGEGVMLTERRRGRMVCRRRRAMILSTTSSKRSSAHLPAIRLISSIRQRRVTLTDSRLSQQV